MQDKKLRIMLLRCQRRIDHGCQCLLRMPLDMHGSSFLNIDPETGRPQGCPSFELKKNGGKVKKADWKNSAVVDCDKNSYAPEGEALSEIVEDFAVGVFVAWLAITRNIHQISAVP